MNCQPQASVALPPGKQSPVPTEYGAWWASDRVSTFWRTEKLVDCTKIRTPDRPLCSLVTETVQSGSLDTHQVHHFSLDNWLTVHRSTTLVDLQLDAQNSYLFTYNTLIKILYMFRAYFLFHNIFLSMYIWFYSCLIM